MAGPGLDELGSRKVRARYSEADRDLRKNLWVCLYGSYVLFAVLVFGASPTSGADPEPLGWRGLVAWAVFMTGPLCWVVWHVASRRSTLRSRTDGVVGWLKRLESRTHAPRRALADWERRLAKKRPRTHTAVGVIYVLGIVVAAFVVVGVVVNVAARI